MGTTGAVGPRFEIVRHLGEGGMSVVYEARDRSTGGRVAIKTLRSPTAESLLRLKQEFRALQEIAHPNLVRYHALVEEDDRWYLAMELVRGDDLRAYVRHDEPAPAFDAPTLQAGDGLRLARGFDEQRLRSAFSQLASALMAIHAAGKVHRDIKPSNVLVQDSGRVVLLDFGLVTDSTANALWTGRHAVGTAAYMAPEQAAGSAAVGAAADWYAVGAMLYELLTGELPFAGVGFRAMADKQHRTPRPVSELLDDPPEDLARLCERLLATSADERPSGAEVLAALGGVGPAALGTPTPASISLDRGQLVGREAELAALHGLLPKPGEQDAVQVYVTGESGVGKTAVVERFLAECATESDVVVLRGKCYERETVPFRAVDGVVDAIARYMRALPQGRAAQLVPRRAALLADAFPVLRGVEVFNELPAPRIPDPHERRQQMFAALRELLARLGERVSVVVSIDDFHWADADSLALLRKVLLVPGAPPLLLVATWRGVSEDSEVPALPGRREHLVVERLNADEALELARARLAGKGPDVGELAEHIAREAGGHPLFIDELVRHAVAGSGETAGETAMSLDDALWQRVEMLPEDQRRVVELVSIAGYPLPQATLATALAVEPADADAAVASLRLERLVRTSRLRDRITMVPYHDRVRQIALRRLDAATVRDHHRALARALRSLVNPDLEALARHLAGAGDRAAAAEVAERAAEEAVAALAFDRGAELFRLALELQATDSEQRPPLFGKLGDALARAGRGAESAWAYESAREGAPVAVALDMQWRAAQQWLVSGHLHEGLAALEPVLLARGVKLPATPRAALWSLAWQRARLRLRGTRFTRRDETEIAADELALIDLYWYVGTSLGPIEFLRGNDFYTRGVRAALRAGEPRRIARALYNEAVFRAAGGLRAEPGCEKLRARAAAAALGIDDPLLHALAEVSRGAGALLSGRMMTAWEQCARAAERLRTDCPGATVELSLVRAFGCVALTWAGELTTLRAFWAPWLHDSRERGHRFTELVLTTYAGAYMKIAADRPYRAVEAGLPFLERAESFSNIEYYALMMVMAAYQYAGRPLRATAVLDRCQPALKRSLMRRVQGVQSSLVDAHGRAAVAAATIESDVERRWLRTAAHQARTIAGCSVVQATGFAATIRAGIETVRGRPERALAELSLAEREFESIGMRLHLAAARRRRGQLLGGDEGGALIASADAAFADQGVIDPLRFATMLAPGTFPGDDGAGLLESAYDRPPSEPYYGL